MSHATGGDKKRKSAMSTAVSSSDDLILLTRSDIPTIVSTVLQFMRSTDDLEDGEPTVPG